MGFFPGTYSLSFLFFPISTVPTTQGAPLNLTLTISLSLACLSINIYFASHDVSICLEYYKDIFLYDKRDVWYYDDANPCMMFVIIPRWVRMSGKGGFGVWVEVELNGEEGEEMITAVKHPCLPSTPPPFAISVCH